MDNVVGARLLRYEDYLTGICDSIGCSKPDQVPERLTKLKAEVAKSRDAFSRVAEVEAELEKAKSQVAELQSALEGAKAGQAVAEASVSRHLTEKKLAYNELVDVKLALAREQASSNAEKAAKEAAEQKLESWRTNYELCGRKMNCLFDLITPHLESCRPFRDEIRPFFAEFEAEDLEAFDQETADLDAEKEVGGAPAKEVRSTESPSAEPAAIQPAIVVEAAEALTPEQPSAEGLDKENV